ncbi:hypothetical protein B0H10DRAFT_1831570, partial [Mycena sp. CBHHK59/15]
IVSAQQYLSDAMNKKLPGWEREGWVGIPYREVLHWMAAELKVRTAPTFFKVTEPGMPGRAICKRASRLAKRAARAPAEEKWDLTLPPNMSLPGLSLQGNHQKTFYRSIREEKTKRNLETVQLAAYETFRRPITDADIWSAVHVKGILPQVTQFLWKGIHNAHKAGAYWVHIPKCGNRAICAVCETLESLEHILIHCDCPGRELIWGTAKALWLEKESDWLEVSLGSILGCGLAEFHDDGGKAKHGMQWLYRILMSESAYLIWRIHSG